VFIVGLPITHQNSATGTGGQAQKAGIANSYPAGNDCRVNPLDPKLLTT
jgi:hypothetical protein